jgi:amino-acid N-acetyltransferase
MYTLRPAERADAAIIRSLVNREHLNPLDLDWRHFIVAESAQGQVIGCGQIKIHSDGSHEMASIVVAPDWRLRGVGKALIDTLMASYPGDLYLTCRSQLGVFYMRFGFRVVEEANMPPYFRRLSRLARWAVRLLGSKESMLVMKRLP